MLLAVSKSAAAAATKAGKGADAASVQAAAASRRVLEVRSVLE